MSNKVVLVSEMAMNGTREIATLLYYSPAMLRNLRTTLQKSGVSNANRKGLELGLTKMAELYQEARIELKNKRRTGGGVFTVDVAKFAEAAKTPDTFLAQRVDFKVIGADAQAITMVRAPLDVSGFPAMRGLGEIPGKRVAVIGVGGGSDGIQAAQLAELVKKQGKSVPIVISVRTVKPGSPGPGGKFADTRTIEKHGG